jgi:hypothetical protein
MDDKPAIHRPKFEIEEIPIPLNFSEHKLIDFIINHLLKYPNLLNTDIKDNYNEEILTKITEKLILLDIVESEDKRLKNESPFSNLSEASKIFLTDNAKKITYKYGSYKRHLSIIRHQGCAYYLDSYGSFIGGISGILALIITFYLAFFKKEDTNTIILDFEKRLIIQEQRLFDLQKQIPKQRIELPIVIETSDGNTISKKKKK